MTLDPKDIQQEIMKLPPDKQKEVLDFIELVKQEDKPKEKKYLKLDWAGELKDLKDKYTSVELQKSAWEPVD